MAATKHSPNEPESKKGFVGTLSRVTCACGWRGCWWKDLTGAELSYFRHEQEVAVTFRPLAINVEGTV